MGHQVLLFYKYVTIKDPLALREWVLTQASSLGLLGRVLVAEEGLNGTLEGTHENTELFAQALTADVRFLGMNIKRSVSDGNSFPKISVRVRDEIVGTKFDKGTINPQIKTGIRINPRELHSWYENEKDFVIVDMRNDYEYSSGHFKNSINPGLENSRDLPKVLPRLEGLKHKTVLTVCTGGVRCEKMSAYLLANGFTDVYQLENGIHSYMQAYPKQEFEGTLYTFDKRVTMDPGGTHEVIGRCSLCNAKTESYVNCANKRCNRHFLACIACQEQGKQLCSANCGVDS